MQNQGLLVEDSKGISFIAQNDSGNGFVTRVLNDKQYREFNGNSIIVGRQTGIVYFQPEKFVTTDGVLVLEPSDVDLNQLSGLFFTAILQNHLNHFGYTNTVSAQKLNEIEVILPTIKSKIAFNFMEKYIKALEAYLLVSGFKDYQLTQDEEDALEVFENQQWQEFRMGDLFDRVKTKKLPYKAKELPKEPQGDFSLPALTSSFMNQGLNYYVPKEGATVLQNVISIPSNSDVYRAYFQSQEFTVLSDAYAIDWIGSDKQLRPNDYLFMVPSINKVTDLPIYSYKNKLGGWNVVKDKLIKLPVNEQGEINFDYMATLVQAIKKLAIKDVVLYADKQIEATKEVVTK
ncbi:restriction endonuclease subunit S [Streptococcus oralis]|uniref:restriction endonuclease subunit S n=1 Tax=Streptococcus oralis TaxID=1303 RepID=UPI002001539B